MVIVEYVGGIKKKDSQICLQCGHKSRDVKDFVLNGCSFGPIIVEEMCVDCDGKNNKYREEEFGIA